MTNIQIAGTIMQQLGGQPRLCMMLAASNFLAGDNYLMFSFKGSRKANKCRITLNQTTDTYKFELLKFSPKYLTCPVVYTLEDVYNDMLMDLFEQETGLYLTLAPRSN